MGESERREDPLMESVRCNLCDSDESELWGIKENIRIIRCKHCGLVYCNPRPDNDELQGYYSDAYFTDGHYDGDVQRQRMYEIEIREILKNITDRGKFLDIGCAMGKFLSSLPETFEKWGTEFSEAAARTGRERFNLNIMTGQVRNIELPEKYFDIVQMRGVLEHSQNPYEDLIRIRKVLKDEGTLRISQLPNIDSICGKLFRTRFNQVKPGEHLYYFTPATIKAMMGKAGFKVVKIMYPYLGTPYETLFKDAMHVVTFLLSGNESPPFFRNMMIVYANKSERA